MRSNVVVFATIGPDRFLVAHTTLTITNAQRLSQALAANLQILTTVDPHVYEGNLDALFLPASMQVGILQTDDNLKGAIFASDSGRIIRKQIADALKMVISYRH